MGPEAEDIFATSEDGIACTNPDCVGQGGTDLSPLDVACPHCGIELEGPLSSLVHWLRKPWTPGAFATFVALAAVYFTGRSPEWAEVVFLIAVWAVAAAIAIQVLRRRPIALWAFLGVTAVMWLRTIAIRALNMEGVTLDQSGVWWLEPSTLLVLLALLLFAWTVYEVIRDFESVWTIVAVVVLLLAVLVAILSIQQVNIDRSGAPTVPSWLSTRLLALSLAISMGVAAGRSRHTPAERPRARYVPEMPELPRPNRPDRPASIAVHSGGREPPLTIMRPIVTLVRFMRRVLTFWLYRARLLIVRGVIGVQALVERIGSLILDSVNGVSRTAVRVQRRLRIIVSAWLRLIGATLRWLVSHLASLVVKVALPVTAAFIAALASLLLADSVVAYSWDGEGLGFLGLLAHGAVFVCLVAVAVAALAWPDVRAAWTNVGETAVWHLMWIVMLLFLVSTVLISSGAAFGDSPYRFGPASFASLTLAVGFLVFTMVTAWREPREDRTGGVRDLIASRHRSSVGGASPRTESPAKALTVAVGFGLLLVYAPSVEDQRIEARALTRPEPTMAEEQVERRAAVAEIDKRRSDEGDVDPTEPGTSEPITSPVPTATTPSTTLPPTTQPDPTLILTSGTFSVLESGRVGTVVGTLEAQGVEGSVRYELDSADGSLPFDIDRFSGDLIVANQLDFDQHSSYQFVVRAVHFGRSFQEVTAIQTVTVVDVVEDFVVGAFNDKTAEWAFLRPDGSTYSISFGEPGDRGFLGDWDCDGTVSPGVFRGASGRVYLTNVTSAPEIDYEFRIFRAERVPVVGDLDGTGCDALSWHDLQTEELFVHHSLPRDGDTIRSEDADHEYNLSEVPGTPLFADVTGDGVDDLVIFDRTSAPGTISVALWERSAGVEASSTYLDAFEYGQTEDVVIFADWDGDGDETIAAFRPRDGTLHIRNSNTSGAADEVGAFSVAAGYLLAGVVGIPAP